MKSDDSDGVEWAHILESRRTYDVLEMTVSQSPCSAVGYGGTQGASLNWISDRTGRAVLLCAAVTCANGLTSQSLRYQHTAELLVSEVGLLFFVI